MLLTSTTQAPREYLVAECSQNTFIITEKPVVCFKTVQKLQQQLIAWKITDDEGQLDQQKAVMTEVITVMIS